MSRSTLSTSVSIFSKRIQMRIWMLPNTDSERMLLEYEYGSDVFLIRSRYRYKEVIDSCLIMSRLYNGREINLSIFISTFVSKFNTTFVFSFCNTDPDIYHIHFHRRPDSDITTSIFILLNTNVG
jgi:hypothetical protein